MGGRSRRASSVPFVDVAEGAAADEVAAAEPRLDGGRHRRRVRHASLPRDPAAGLGFWRAGIAAAFGRRLPPGARVWIRGGVRLALLAASGFAHFDRSRDLALVPGLRLFVRGGQGHDRHCCVGPSIMSHPRSTRSKMICINSRFLAADEYRSVR